MNNCAMSVPEKVTLVYAFDLAKKSSSVEYVIDSI